MFAVYGAYILALYWHSIDTLLAYSDSGILSGSHSGICSGTLLCINSGLLCGILQTFLWHSEDLSGIWGMYSGILSGSGHSGITAIWGLVLTTAI